MTKIIATTNIWRLCLVGFVAFVVALVVCFATLQDAIALTPDEISNNCKKTPMEIHAINLGKHETKSGNKHHVGGDAVLIKSSGKYLLMDTGDKLSFKQLDAYLKKEVGTKPLDLYISHHHPDHFGSYKKLLPKYNIQTVYLYSKELGLYNSKIAETKAGSLRAMFEKCLKGKNGRLKKKLNFVYLNKEATGELKDSFWIGDDNTGKGAKVSIIGSIGTHEKEDSKANNISMIAKIEGGDMTYLSCGDIQENASNTKKKSDKLGEEIKLAEAYKSTNVLKADIMKLSHHGIKQTIKGKTLLSNSDRLLKFVRPSISFIQTKGNPNPKNCAGEKASTKSTMYLSGEQSRKVASKYGFCYPLSVKKVDKKLVNFKIICKGGKATMYKGSGIPSTKMTKLVKLEIKYRKGTDINHYIKTYYIDPYTGKRASNTWVTTKEYESGKYLLRYHFKKNGVSDNTKYCTADKKAIKDKWITIKTKGKKKTQYRIVNGNKAAERIK